jgi:enamine deaminase RidA (YjgF/YER057c/UK114 family)
MQRFDPFNGSLGLSLATIHNGLVWVTGMIGVGADFVTTPATTHEQMENTFANIAQVLDGCGSSFAQIIDMTIFFVGESNEAQAAWAALRSSHFPDGLPSLTMVGVARLTEPQYLIEVKVVAATAHTP